MEVDFAFICDYAELASKINALGIGFDTIYAPETPVTHPIFHLVVQLRAHLTESGQKPATIRLIDEDGNDVITPMSGALDISVPPGGTESVGRVNLGFQNVRFPGYGLYSLHVVVQGNEMVRIPLRVAPPPSMAG